MALSAIIRLNRAQGDRQRLRIAIMDGETVVRVMWPVDIPAAQDAEQYASTLAAQFEAQRGEQELMRLVVEQGADPDATTWEHATRIEARRLWLKELYIALEYLDVRTFRKLSPHIERFTNRQLANWSQTWDAPAAARFRAKVVQLRAALDNHMPEPF